MRFFLALAALSLRESSNQKDVDLANLVTAGVLLSYVTTSQKE